MLKKKAFLTKNLLHFFHVEGDHQLPGNTFFFINSITYVQKDHDNKLSVMVLFILLCVHYSSREFFFFFLN